MYQEVNVLLRFDTEKGITLEDVRAYLRHQGTVSPAEICYGEVVTVEGAPWTRQWEAVKQQARLLDKMLTLLNPVPASDPTPANRIAQDLR